MTRFTILSFLFLSGFFYITGQPVDETAAPSKQAVRADASPWDQNARLQAVNEAKFEPSSSTANNAPVKVKTAAAHDLALPARNPRRVAAEKRRVAARKSRERMARLARQHSAPRVQPVSAVGESAGSGEATAAAKPLFGSYQHRYTAPTKPVLGPRLTTVLMQRELRRVGCYGGSINGSLDGATREAIGRFNSKSGQNLAAKANPASLEKLQQAVGTVCQKEIDKNRAIIAATPAERLNAAVKRQTGNSWRSNAQRRKKQVAYEPTYKLNGTSKRQARSRSNDSEIRTNSRPKRKVAKRSKRNYGRRALITKRKVAKRKVARKKARRRTAVRSYRKTYRKKRFGFRRNGGSMELNF